MYDLLIIGGGPAGLSCAYFLATQGYKPNVFEKNERPGGMLRYGIPSFKLEKDVIDAEIDVLRELGVDESTDLREIADSCYTAGGAFREIRQDEIYEIYKECF